MTNNAEEFTFNLALRASVEKQVLAIKVQSIANKTEPYPALLRYLETLHHAVLRNVFGSPNPEECAEKIAREHSLQFK